MTEMPVSTQPGAGPPLLEMRDISVSFGSNRALGGVDLVLTPGEIVALLGKNGSGKSTLIKVLAGYHAPEAGSVAMRGEPLALPISAADVQDHGVAFVHQDLGLFDGLTVTENLMVPLRINAQGRDRARLRPQQEVRTTAKTFERYGLAIDPRARVGDLAAVEKAMLAIVRAAEQFTGVGGQSGVLVLDEPTAFLGAEETERLFALVRQLAVSGTGVLIVTHSLSDVRAVADRAVILRDGLVVASGRVAELSSDEIVAHIIGAPNATGQEAFEALDADGGADAKPTVLATSTLGETLLEARELSGGQLIDFSCAVRAGEILGVAGVLGSGAEEVPYALFGARRLRHGEIAIGGEVIRARDLQPATAIRHGIGLVPGNRLAEGLAGSMSIAENVSLPVLGAHFRGLRLRGGDLRGRARDICADYGVRPPDPGYRLDGLSGGNQQKVLMAKWMAEHPQVLILDEPTQGVDVGAREDLYGLIHAAVADGSAVIWTGSDLAELAEHCDRVCVLAGGRPVLELGGTELTETRLQEAVLGAASQAIKTSTPGALV